MYKLSVEGQCIQSSPNSLCSLKGTGPPIFSLHSVLKADVSEYSYFLLNFLLVTIWTEMELAVFGAKSNPYSSGNGGTYGS